MNNTTEITERWGQEETDENEGKIFLSPLQNKGVFYTHTHNTLFLGLR